MKKLSICIAPLDWGLGHTTRCIPIIKALQHLGHEVTVAAEGPAAHLLAAEIPDITILPLLGYRIQYATKKFFFISKLLVQIPKIITAIIHEYFWLKKTHKKYAFDLIISDNRYGFYHKKINSVLITHQLNIQTPWKLGTLLLQQSLYAWCKRFKQIWIPDSDITQNLSGTLGIPRNLPTNELWYMGSLSRMNDLSFEPAKIEPSLAFLGIVSGPEPQRTIFENLLTQGGQNTDAPFVIVAGRPLDNDQLTIGANGKIYAHLNSSELAKQIQAAAFIICRGGYSSLMDLLPFNKKIIMVPTPGQTEQIYLANWWHANGWAMHIEQSNFSLELAIKKAASFNFVQPTFTPFSVEALKAQLERVSL